MPESLDAFSELREIRARVEGIEHRQEMLVRAHSEEILQTIWAYLDKDAMLGEVYLMIDGSRTQQELLRDLSAKGVTISQAGVSGKMKTLTNELGMIEIAGRDVAGTRYRKTELDRILHLTPKVEKRLADLQRAKSVKKRAG